MSEWQSIETVLKDGSPMRFRMPDGEEFDGVWQPFWCGSDCPCDVANEGDEPFTDEPQCWCAYRTGEKIGMDFDPTHWRPA